MVIWGAALRNDEALIEFFDKNSTDQNKARGDDELIKMIENRHLLDICEEQQGTCGIAGTFIHQEEELGVCYMEMGATVITANGLGLQVITLWIRSLASFISSGPDCEIFSAADENNSASIHNLNKAGFKLWVNPPKWIKDKKLNNKPGLKLFHISKEDLTNAAESLLAIDEEGKIDKSEKGKIAYLAVRARVLTEWKEYTESIANGKFDFFNS